MKEETLADYEIGNLFDLDYLKIFEIIKDVQNQRTKYIPKEFRKSFVNSLFTPLCSYVIEYLNNNKEKKGVIGSAKIDDTKVIYTVLSQNVYDLFFQRTKGKLFEGENEINYDIKYEEENYKRHTLIEKEYNLEELQKIVSSGEEIKDDTEDFKLLNEVFKNK